MRAPGDHKMNELHASQPARPVPPGPLRHTTSQGTASRPRDSTSASQPGLSRSANPPQTNPGPPPQQPKLLDRLAEALRSRHYSPRTERTYRHWVKRCICHAFARSWLRYPNHPRTLGPQGCHDDHDLHPRPEQGRSWCPQPRRSALIRFIQTASIPSAAQDLAAKGIDRKMLRRDAAMRGTVLSRPQLSAIAVLDRRYTHCCAGSARRCLGRSGLWPQARVVSERLAASSPAAGCGRAVAPLVRLRAGEHGQLPWRVVTLAGTMSWEVGHGRNPRRQA
jgi:hypothetical protein